MKVPQACIFDLDGVIVDTAHFHFKAWKRLADTLNIPLSKQQNESLKGVSREQSLQKILELDDRSVSPDKFRELMDRKNRRYLEQVAELTSEDILEGVPEFIDRLEQMGVKIAIGSASRNAPRILDSLELNDRFGAVIDGNKVERTKPDPEVFLNGAEALGVDPSECLVFEDAVSGVEAARRAGMDCIGVGEDNRFEQADLVIPGFRGLTPEKLFPQMS